MPTFSQKTRNNSAKTVRFEEEPAIILFDSDCYHYYYHSWNNEGAHSKQEFFKKQRDLWYTAKEVKAFRTTCTTSNGTIYEKMTKDTRRKGFVQALLDVQREHRNMLGTEQDPTGLLCFSKSQTKKSRQEALQRALQAAQDILDWGDDDDTDYETAKTTESAPSQQDP